MTEVTNTNEVDASVHFDRAAEALTEYCRASGAEAALAFLEGGERVHYLLENVAELIECNYPALHAELEKMRNANPAKPA